VHGVLHHSRRRAHHIPLLPSHAEKIITKRLEPTAAPKRDMLQSFITQGLRGEALKQEIGIQL
jgi:hypothetical protein